MQKRKLILPLVLGFSLTACMQPADDPNTVAEKYWLHMQTGNVSEAEKLVSTNSRHNLSEQIRLMESIEQVENGEASTTVTTTITTISPDTNYRDSKTFNTILVLQQGKWKVDLNNSQVPPAPNAKEEELQQLAEELSDSMQENMDSIDEAMNQGMQLLNEAVQDGSKEMGDSLLHLMNELNSSMQESIEQMKRRRQQQLEQQEKQETLPSTPQPDPRRGEGMI